jgi:hypothetical protein
VLSTNGRSTFHVIAKYYNSVQRICPNSRVTIRKSLKNNGFILLSSKRFRTKNYQTRLSPHTVLFFHHNIQAESKEWKFWQDHNSTSDAVTEFFLKLFVLIRWLHTRTHKPAIFTAHKKHSRADITPSCGQLNLQCCRSLT